MIQCKGCKGIGSIPLFTSLAKCDECKGTGLVLSEKERIKRKLIAEYIKIPGRRMNLAESMAQPLRTRRDYDPIGRKSFRKKQAA